MTRKKPTVLNRLQHALARHPNGGRMGDPGPLGYYRHRSVLVTGAGGTVGTELCRQLIRYKPARLVLVDRSELNLTTLLRQIKGPAMQQGITLHSVLDCVTGTERMQQLMQNLGVSVVLHAAAFKHVPMVEAHPVAGIQNNVFGTVSVARAAQAAGVARFVLISTDKAIAPEGILGASKLLAERAIWNISEQGARTRFSAVRFGNIYGSSGSVVRVWREQIAAGQPMTLTDPQATRFFMSSAEAAQLVLRAAVMTQGADLFALDMGRARRMGDVAKMVAQRAGKPDHPIQTIGLQPGERLHEPRPVSGVMERTDHPRIYRADPDQSMAEDIRLLLRSLASAISAYDEAAVRRLVGQWIYANGGQQSRQSN